MGAKADKNPEIEAPAKEVVPEATPTETTIEKQIEATEKKAKKVAEQLKAEEIAGASESSVHALSEQLKALNEKLDSLGASHKVKRYRWLP